MMIFEQWRRRWGGGGLEDGRTEADGSLDFPVPLSGLRYGPDWKAINNTSLPLHLDDDILGRCEKSGRGWCHGGLPPLFGIIILLQ